MTPALILSGMRMPSDLASAVVSSRFGKLSVRGLPLFVLGYLRATKSYASAAFSASWALREVRGEWRGRSAGGCRNYPSWVMNPLYSLRAPRDTQCEVFLRQPEKPPLPAADGAYGTTDPTYDGVGFYVTRDDGELNLEDVEAQSGFERAQEVSGHCDLRANQVRATRRRLSLLSPKSHMPRPTPASFSPSPPRAPTRSTCSSR